MTTAAFLYSVALQFQRANLSNLSEWVNLLHLTLTASVLFLVSFSSGMLVTLMPRYHKHLVVVLSFAFAFGLIFVGAVLVVLWLETRL